MRLIQNRRCFMAGLSALGAASSIGLPTSLYAEPPVETTTVRIGKYTGPTICEAPKYVAAELLRAEGFTDVRYVESPNAEDVDFDTDFVPGWINWIENAEQPWTVLAGLHSGCLQLIVNESIQTVLGLRGKTVGVDSKISAGYRQAMIMFAYVGLDPYRDVAWLESDKASLVELLADRKIDAFLGSPPDPQEVLARKIGHSILNTTFDSPWSDYFCCMLGGSADFVAKYPIATKRVVRSFLKAVDICRSEPTAAAQSVIDYGITKQYDYTLEALTEARYDRWRDFDPDDSLRFYALRMQEVGFVKSTPQEIIAKGTDWRFLNELRRELKT